MQRQPRIPGFRSRVHLDKSISAFVLGMVMAITGRLWGPAAEAMVFAVMAVVLIYKPIEV